MSIETAHEKEAIERNFARPIWLLMGLPIDTVSEQETLTQLHQAVTQSYRCFLSTPNLNFVMMAKEESEFRQSLIDSDLNCVDGFPLVKVAKWLGVPVTERVAGATLMEAITLNPTFNGQSIFLFGGAEGVAEIAQQKINASPDGATVCGYYTPGFGSVEEMSTPEIINTINESAADYVIVALGAKKGQQWIQHNKEKLNAKVLTHFGAAINFSAGVVDRAPQLAQRLHLEWAWRIYQEPMLWKRYFDDGSAFLSLLIKNILPYAWWLRGQKSKLEDAPLPQAIYHEDEQGITITLAGIFRADRLNELRKIFSQAAVNQRPITLEMSGVEYIDGAFLGLLTLLQRYANAASSPLHLAHVPPHIQRVMHWNML